MKKYLIPLLTLFLLTGCATYSPQLKASPECRHLAPFIADIFEDTHQLPVRIGIRTMSERKIANISVPLSHAWAEAHIDGTWQELGLFPDGSVGVVETAEHLNTGQQYFDVIEFRRYRENLRMMARGEGPLYCADGLKAC